MSFTLPDPAKSASIIRLALCPTAPEGEWHAAAIAFFRMLPRSGATAIDKSEEHAILPIMAFGKYKGKTVRWIVNTDPAYVEWLLRSAGTLSASLRQEFSAELRSRYK